MVKPEACKFFHWIAYKTKVTKLPLFGGNRERSLKNANGATGVFPFVLSRAAVLLHTVEILLTIANPRLHANTPRCLTVSPQTLNNGFEPVNNFTASETVIFPVFRLFSLATERKMG
jgi:hypothetical protein